MEPMGAAVTENTRPLPSLDLNDPTEARLAGCARRISQLLNSPGRLQLRRNDDFACHDFGFFPFAASFFFARFFGALATCRGPISFSCLVSAAGSRSASARARA
jgi:hypothetical protein